MQRRVCNCNLTFLENICSEANIVIQWHGVWEKSLDFHMYGRATVCWHEKKSRNHVWLVKIDLQLSRSVIWTKLSEVGTKRVLLHFVVWVHLWNAALKLWTQLNLDHNGSFTPCNRLSKSVTCRLLKSCKLTLTTNQRLEVILFFLNFSPWSLRIQFLRFLRNYFRHFIPWAFLISAGLYTK